MIAINADGFDDVIKKLDDIDNKARNLSGTKHSVDATELFDASFMARYTKFKHINDMLSAAGLADKEDPESPEWDAFIAVNTPFANYEEMAKKGAEEWTARQLGL